MSDVDPQRGTTNWLSRLVWLGLGCLLGGGLMFATQLPHGSATKAATLEDQDVFRFAAPEASVMRISLVPEGLDSIGASDVAMILTRHATGGAPMLIETAETLQRAGVQSWVQHRHLSGGQNAAALVFTLGTAAENWKPYAVLLQDGEVVDTLRCWQCDIRSPDFQGANVSALLAAGRPATAHHTTFPSQAEFDAALTRAQADPAIWIDRNAQFGRAGTDEAPFWVLNLWERGSS